MTTKTATKRTRKAAAVEVRPDRSAKMRMARDPAAGGRTARHTALLKAKGIEPAAVVSADAQAAVEHAELELSKAMVTLAGRLGARVARELKLHVRKPFGPRGEALMVEHARAAWHAALAEAGPA